MIRDARITISIRQAAVGILPGKRTPMWTFDGTFPGPTIRRPSGQPTDVEFVHKLPAAAGDLSVHLHGGHSKSIHDGWPGGYTADDPSFFCKATDSGSASAQGNDLLIAPGHARTYRYEHMDNGAPERAAMRWYHEHRCGFSGRNIWRGLVGLYILDDEIEDSLRLPSGKYDIPLIVCDRSFNADNSLTDPYKQPQSPPGDATTGNVTLVNGAPQPYVHVAARKYRLRILNAANFEAYNFQFSSPTDPWLRQIATESGLMPTPVYRKTILLGPAERAEIVVDFSDYLGQTITLESLPDDNPRAGATETGTNSPVMQFKVTRKAKDRSRVPGRLRPLPAWTRELSPSPDRTWVFGLGLVEGTLEPAWTINGKPFDASRVDATPALGQTETWSLVNASQQSHFVHIHDVSWLMLSRDSEPPDPWEAVLKETFRLDPGEVVVVGSKFTDHVGKFILHCHMLDHEDHGMMARYDVIGPGDTRYPDTPKRHRRPKPSHLGLPAGRTCIDVLRFRVRAPHGERLVSARVLVDGREVHSLHGKSLHRELALSHLPRGEFRVTIVAKTADGHTRAAARRYHRCTDGSSAGRAGRR